MVANWTLRSLHFGRKGGQYAPASTEEVPDLSEFGIPSVLKGRDGKISRFVLIALMCCCCLLVVVSVVVSVAISANNAAAEETAEAVLSELASGAGSGYRLSSKVG
tara:strand:- start:93 stop:410 length:318 start_codon:yes stop_codon:yes gene_type:complete